jgi:uncharacterized membrane protein YedE/YeeE
MGLNGKIAGISGILSRLLTKDIGGTAERPGLFFVLGLLLAAPGWMLVTGQWPQQTISAGPVALIIAGLAVGYGSVTGNGCTSGHGVCGLSRLSGRSMVATATFMSTAAITVFIVRHVI